MVNERRDAKIGSNRHITYIVLRQKNFLSKILVEILVTMSVENALKNQTTLSSPNRLVANLLQKSLPVLFLLLYL